MKKAFDGLCENFSPYDDLRKLIKPFLLWSTGYETNRLKMRCYPGFCGFAIFDISQRKYLCEISNVALTEKKAKK